MPKTPAQQRAARELLAEHAERRRVARILEANDEKRAAQQREMKRRNAESRRAR